MAVIDDVNQRKEKISQLIADAKLDPEVDDGLIIKFLYINSIEAEVFAYSWDINYLKNKMDEEIETNWSWLKAFLLGLTTWENQIYQFILDYLSD